jgi:hypothetical protein
MESFMFSSFSALTDNRKRLLLLTLLSFIALC